MSGSINRDNQDANNFCDPFLYYIYDLQSLQYFQDLSNLQGLQELENFEYNKGNQDYNNPEDTYYHSCIQLFQDLYNLGDHHEIQEPHAYNASHVQFFHNNDIDNYHVQELHDYDLD
ncbi:3573_t:CDS:2 [Gigaspora rosea]|nr:3573_t:CDS:2 [Gigaspora rosea]